MGSDFRGDPSSAMLEVLDPEQNHAFRDHYLDLPFDLSDVMFVTTANTLDTIPRPAARPDGGDPLAGYTEAEKLEIAKRYLVPRQIERNGLSPSRIAFTDPALRMIISDYTREAGVRQLEREIGTICRKVARQVAEGDAEAQGHDHRAARSRVARASASSSPRPAGGRRARASPPGWPGRRWAARCCSSRRPRCPAGTADDHRPARRGDAGVGAGRALLRAQQRRRTSSRTYPRTGSPTHDIHIHVPAGATPKDGPSAGVAMVTALASLLTGRPVRADVAMTGEITLTGPGAADRRAEGEGAGRAAQRDPSVIAPGAERAGRRRDPGAPAQGPRVPLRLDGRGGARDRAPAAGRPQRASALRAPAARAFVARLGSRLGCGQKPHGALDCVS